jgi:hypothetical protein
MFSKFYLQPNSAFGTTPLPRRGRGVPCRHGLIAGMTSVSAQGDDRDDVRWMTYAELGRIRGISTASATRLAFRRKWQRQGGNDGTARVAVPVNEAQRQPERIHDDRDDDRGDVRRLVSALEAAIAVSGERARADAATVGVLSGQVEQVQAELDGERRGREAERIRADRAEQGREGERARADALRDRLEVLQAHAEERAGRAENDVFELKGQLATAQIAVAEAGREAESARQATHAFLDEDAARRRLGVLARLRAAWRRE